MSDVNGVIHDPRLRTFWIIFSFLAASMDNLDQSNQACWIRRGESVAVGKFVANRIHLRLDEAAIEHRRKR